MTNAADLDSVVSSVDEKQPVITNAQAHLFRVTFEGLHVPTAGFGKTVKSMKIRMTVGLSRARISDLAWSVQTICFKPVPGSF